MNAVISAVPATAGVQLTAGEGKPEAKGASQGGGAAATAAPPRPAGPVRWRLALLTLVGVYPVITVYLYALLPLTEGWQTWQRTLLLAPLMVLTIVYFIAPQLQKHFGWFLRPRPRH